MLSGNVLVIRLIHWSCQPGYVAPFLHLIDTESHQVRPIGMLQAVQQVSILLKVCILGLP